jgi:hypothetical protein
MLIMSAVTAASALTASPSRLLSVWAWVAPIDEPPLPPPEVAVPSVTESPLVASRWSPGPENSAFYWVG